MFKTLFVVIAFVAAAFAGIAPAENVRQERAIYTTGGLYGGYTGYNGYNGYSGVVSPLAYSATPYTYSNAGYGGYSSPVISSYSAYPAYNGIYSGAYPSVRYV